MFSFSKNHNTEEFKKKEARFHEVTKNGLPKAYERQLKKELKEAKYLEENI